jgi:hypothetical protein
MGVSQAPTRLRPAPEVRRPRNPTLPGLRVSAANAPTCSCEPELETIKDALRVEVPRPSTPRVLRSDWNEAVSQDPCQPPSRHES